MRYLRSKLILVHLNHKLLIVTGRFYVTSGTAGVVGGAAGIAHAQKQALVSVTRYIKLPDAAPNFDVIFLLDWLHNRLMKF